MDPSRRTQPRGEETGNGPVRPIRVALVTGSSRGIGAATARLLASRGMRVAVNYLNGAEEAQRVAEAIGQAGGDALTVQGDVRDPDAVERLLGTVTDHWGPVDVLVHNALIPYPIKSFHDLGWDELSAKIDQEMHAAFLLTKGVLPGMTAAGYGRIVYLGTGLSQRPREKMLALGTAKAALTQFARFVAQEVASTGITVNVVSPGPVDGTAHAHVFGDEHNRHQAAITSIGRIASPDDVARVVAFYAGDDSRFVTGANAAVNGGVSMD